MDVEVGIGLVRRLGKKKAALSNIVFASFGQTPPLRQGTYLTHVPKFSFTQRPTCGRPVPWAEMVHVHVRRILVRSLWVPTCSQGGPWCFRPNIRPHHRIQVRMEHFYYFHDLRASDELSYSQLFDRTLKLLLIWHNLPCFITMEYKNSKSIQVNVPGNILKKKGAILEKSKQVPFSAPTMSHPMKFTFSQTIPTSSGKGRCIRAMGT